MENTIRLNTPGQSTALLAVGLMAVIIMMVVPVPAFLLDLGLTASFSLAILIFTATIFAEKPLDFSAFPTVLLASLMLRLSLNVSSTKLIIGQGHTGPDAAGSVIHGFAMFVMGGNILLGLVVFGVLLIVNFLVITKGAGRMAEVGARFALDAMPGKQLAIDSDVAAGALSHEEAKSRRQLEQDETTFFGSLDGASKFVKGDAVAGLLITALNLIVGLAMGVAMHGMSLDGAITTYSILTVGDGLVSQIPAVIISIAAAMLLSKGGVAGSADKAMLAQLGKNSIAISTVGGIMTVFALLPGLPFAPFFIGGVTFFIVAYLINRNERAASQNINPAEETQTPPETKKPLGDILDVDEIHVEFGGNLVAIVLDSVSGLEPRLTKIRRFITREFGFIIPPIRLTDNLAIPKNEYRIRIQDVLVGSGTIYTDHVLVILDKNTPLNIDGVDVEEPVYNASARWIENKYRSDVEAVGLSAINPTEVISTHLLETIKQNFSQLVTRRSVRRIFDEYSATTDRERAESNRRLIEDLVPTKVSVEFVQNVFRILLDEMVSIRNLPIVLEAIAEGRELFATAEDVTEFVRQRIAKNIVAKALDSDGNLPLIQVGMGWEEVFEERSVAGSNNQVNVALQPEEFNKLSESIMEKVRDAAATNTSPAIVTLPHRRRFIKTILKAKKIDTPVFSYEEIDPATNILVIGVA